MKREKSQQPSPSRSRPQRRKISEMIGEFAGDFLRLGTTPEQKQNCLNGVCVAWNIASAPPERRKILVDHFLAHYKRHNPSADDAALAAIRSDVVYLIDVKLKRFPLDLRQVVDARISRVGGKDRIEAAAVRNGFKA